MRIMHMILSRGFAGSERTVAQMANTQCRAHQVAVVLKRAHRNRHGVSITRWLDPRVQVIEVPNWFPKRAIARAINDFEPAVIHAHLRRSTKMLAKIRPEAATIVTLHITVNGPHFADMDGIICIAQWQHDVIPPGYRGHVFHINPGYVPHYRLAPQQIETLRGGLGVERDEFLIGGVGRLTHKKGFDVLIEAFRRADLPSAKLVILGEGSERRRLERMSTPDIVLAGFRENIKGYYQAFDLFVCPSRQEPFGFVLLEALDAGVPVIASDAKGPSDVLGKFPGDRFPSGDVDALAALLSKHAAAGRCAKIPQDLGAYALDEIAAQTEAAYRELIDDRFRRTCPQLLRQSGGTREGR
jgi:glycosyltransferase involved in cell wall biosynthesis